jgi:hypothetical protein
MTTATRTVVAAMFLVAAGAAFADEVRDTVAVERAMLESDRQAVVAANLPLSEEQAKVFWPMFREYRGELAKVGDRVVELVLDYAKNVDTLTDEQATAMVTEMLAIQKEENRIRSSWVPKFSKTLEPKKLARFYQIEGKLDAVIRYEAAAQIPLIEAAND